MTKKHFSALYEMMLHEQDENNAYKMMELYEKYLNNEYIICFSGHFSAGKSSIINELLDKDVLPKSPIPTSANIVKITSGEGVAKVYFKDDEPVKYQAPYDIDMIKDYCMDRDTIRQIEISTEEFILPQHTALFDSPGIDAADDADRLMTESAMHLIDQLFYVMDYNHVQSEINLYFLQKIQKLSIPIYIIINQVDKHQEAEIPFSDYDQVIKQTFDQWNIQPENIYYTTILDPAHPHNEFNHLKEDVFKELSKTNDIQPKIIQSAESIVNAHHLFLKNKYENQLSADNDTSNETDAKYVDDLENQLAEIHQKSVTFEHSFNQEVQTTLSNANVMPRNIRDLAESFLLAQEKDFKIGFFQSKKKTAEEIDRRQQTFEEALKEIMENTIQWKLREKVIALLQTYGLADETLLEKVQQLNITFSQEDLLTHLKQGATVNGNYVLNYTNDVSAGIKAKYRNEMNKLWQAVHLHAQNMFQKEEDKITKELAPYKSMLQQMIADESLLKELAEKQAAVQRQWEYPSVTNVGIEKLEQAITQKNQLREETLPEQMKNTKQSAPLTESQTRNEEKSNSYDTSQMISAIEGVIEEVTEMKGFQSIITELEKKKSRLKDRELTIALFGTFSAGKSSFSNALFGERVLPVSPNPTTAVINRISPVTDEQPHGTVNIAIKSNEEMISDLKVITKHITKQSMSLDEWIQWIQKERIHEHSALSKTYQAYLNAVIVGYEEQKVHLASNVTIPMDDFANYVTNETIACFIKEVNLYYDCALTKKGITLVDTPGADSVNARHTNVAFDYIKEADAILYVTYYNHAITRGDKDFLIQLGRVKEAFEMDKMFFIVNASDLAENDTDLKLVVDYVTEQLLAFGIRNPNIYPVSSKKSLEEKLTETPLNNQMNQFEEAFYTFIDQDLMMLTAESAIWDMNRTQKTLDTYIQSLELNANEREQKIELLKSQRTKAVQLIHEANMNVFEERFMNRIDRQLHFVMERLYIRFHDMFTEYFNPSTINEVGKKATSQLEQNRNEFVDYVGYEMLQEVRAVSLRIEAYMRELLKEAFQMNQVEAQKINEAFIFPSQPHIDFTTPAYDQAFEQIDMSNFQKALKIYKNMKSFFEQNEREKMELAFYNILKPKTEMYLQTANKQMKASYHQSWNQHVAHMKHTAEEGILLIEEEYVSMLETTVDTEALKSAHQHINETIQNIS